MTAGAALTTTTVTLTTIIAFLAVLAGFGSAVLGLLNANRAKRTEDAVKEIQVNVNGNLAAQGQLVADLIARQEQLMTALHQAGAEIPEPEAPPPPPPLPGLPRAIP